MEKILVPLLVSFLISLLTTIPTIKLANKFKLLDNPKLRPHPAHIQNRIIPRAGGLPVYIGIVLSIFLFVPMAKSIIGILLALTVLLIIGLLDDYLRNLSPYPRLLIQFLAAAIVVVSGVGITYVTNPWGGILRLDEVIIPLNFFGQHNIVLIADIFAFFWIVWMMNMVNWAKGVDGQMSTIISVAAVTIGLLSWRLSLNGDPNQLIIATLSFITAGSALGFLVFNWHPAKIIPGFSGSTILGFMIATLSILSGAKLATALLVVLVPSIDFFYTFFRRILSGKSPFYGDQLHLHHLLLRRGWTHQQITFFYFLTSAVLGLAAANLSSEGKLFAAIGVGTILFGVILWLHLFYKEKETK